MNEKTTSDLIENGYSVINNCLDKKLLDIIKDNINNNLITLLKENKKNSFGYDISKNYYEAIKTVPDKKNAIFLITGSFYYLQEIN